MKTDLHVLCYWMSAILSNYRVRFFNVMDGAHTTQIRKIKMVQCTKRSAEMCYTVHAYSTIKLSALVLAIIQHSKVLMIHNDYIHIFVELYYNW